MGTSRKKRHYHRVLTHLSPSSSATRRVRSEDEAHLADNDISRQRPSEKAYGKSADNSDEARRIKGNEALGEGGQTEGKVKSASKMRDVLKTQDIKKDATRLEWWAKWITNALSGQLITATLIMLMYSH